MAKELDDCTPLELHEEIRSIDCTQERAHDIRRYSYKVSRGRRKDKYGFCILESLYQFRDCIQDKCGMSLNPAL